MKTLVQVRPCDGKCCEESPRWPNADNTDCIYRKVDGKETFGCMLMTGEASMLEDESPTNPDQSAEKTFQETCVDWPQNSSRGTGGCCWQWVDGD